MTDQPKPATDAERKDWLDEADIDSKFHGDVIRSLSARIDAVEARADGLERERDACCDDYQKEAARADMAEENYRDALARWEAEVLAERKRIAELEAANANNLAAWADNVAGLNRKIARLEAENERLREGAPR